MLFISNSYSECKRKEEIRQLSTPSSTEIYSELSIGTFIYLFVKREKSFFSISLLSTIATRPSIFFFDL